LRADAHSDMPRRPPFRAPFTPPTNARRARALAECLAGAHALALGHTDAALEHYAAGVALAPQDADIAALHGVALRSTAKLADAQQELIRAIALDHTRADSYTQLAQTYRMAGDRSQAATAFLAAAQLRSQDAMAWRDAAESLRLADRLTEGLRAAQHAAALAPENASIANTTALLLHRANRVQDARDVCTRARRIDPDDLHLALTHGMLCRTLGDYDTGWALYERRLELPAFTQRAYAPPTPRWDGSPLAGRTILVRAEQGMGDQIHFVRWACVLRARGAARVILQAAPSLVRLMRSAPCIDVVVASDRPAPPHAVHVDCASLPHLLRTGADMRADLVPYLSPPPTPSPSLTDASTCHSLMRPVHAHPRLRIGIVWGGSPLQEDNRFRSVPLPGLLAAITRPDVDIVVLQQGAARAQLTALDAAQRAALIDAAPHCADMADTATVAAACDVVLSMCTSVAHLSGALGLTTWLMLAAPAEWRWGIEGDASVLYPTMRLFRQQQAGDWSTVFDALRHAIAEWFEEPRT
jgi:tetratricopeptide (TPR) repeat protein